MATNGSAISRQIGIVCALALLPFTGHAELIFNFDSTGNPTVDAAFAAAGARWSALFSDDVVLNIDIGYTSLAGGILGGTTDTDDTFSYSTVRSALAADATSASDATAVANLTPGSSISMLINRTSNDPAGSGSATPYLDADGDANNSLIRMSTANAKALGLIAGDGSENDGSIVFNSDYSFDFDPSDGISAGSYDFVGVATHELGHLLGFVSGVDILDMNSPPYNGAFPEDEFTYVTTLDLFRYSADSFSDGPGVIDWTADVRPKYFSIDGGADGIAAFATGVNFGDGRQASHWQDGQGLGIMDPTAAPGELLGISANDIEALDVIGWNVAAPEPSSYLLLGLGVAGVLARLLRRRPLFTR